MSGPIPYLGSKISLISKSEIRYEGILYTIDAQESIIALAKVRSFGTEDRHAEMPVPARDEVYEYIIFRGSDIKNIEVCDAPKPATLPGGLHNDPAIVQHSAPSVASSFQTAPFSRQSLGPIGPGIGMGNVGSVYGYGPGQPLSQPNLASGRFGALGGTSQSSELNSGGVVGEPSGINNSGVSEGSSNRAEPLMSPISGINSSLPSSLPAPIGAPAPSSMASRHPHSDVLVGSRSSTPTTSRKSPVSDAGVQVSPPPQQERKRSGSSPQQSNYQTQPSIERREGQQSRRGQSSNQGFQYGNRQNQNYQGYNQYQYSNRTGNPANLNRGRAPRRGGPQGRGRGMYSQRQRQQQDARLFEKEFDFDKANEEFEELRTQLAKTKISENGDKKDDSGHETTTDSVTVEGKIQITSSEDGVLCDNPDKALLNGDESEDSSTGPFYDKAKSFFDSISCEALERSKGRSQRPDWRQERKINVQTFGVATARRGFYPRGGRGGSGYYRGGYYRNYNNQGYYNRGNANYRGRGGNGGQMLRGGSVPSVNGVQNVGNGSTSSYASAVRTNAPLK